MFGFVELFMFITVGDRRKRVMLAKIPCDHHEAQDKFLEFRRANEEIVTPFEVHAEFKFTDYLG